MRTHTHTRVCMATVDSKGNVSKICIFVRNLPYSTTDEELEAVFKRYGALASCFTVKDKAKQSRGFAYVTFTKSEDAQRAVSQVKVIGGRPVKLIFVSRKSFLQKQSGDNGESEEEEEEEDYETLTARQLVKRAAVKRTKSERSDPRFDVGRVIVLRNLPEVAKEKRIRKKCEKFGSVQDIAFPSADTCTTAHVTFDSHKSARLAVRELDGSKFSKRSDLVLKVFLLSKVDKPVSNKTLNKSRIIIRNLSFKSSEEEVQKLFGTFGNILNVHIPRKENGHMLGYGFVQFDSYFSAAKAVSEMNKTEVRGREVIVDWALPKSQYEDKKLKKSELSRDECKVSLGESEADMEEGEEVSLAEEGESETDAEGELPEEEEEMEEEEVSLADEGESEADMEGELPEEEEEMEEEEVRDMEVNSEDSHNDVAEDDQQQGDDEVEEAAVVRHRPKQKSDVQEGKTVFIRNLPLDTDQESLRKSLTKFGMVRYCRLMKSKDTGVATGTAFVQFKSQTAAQKCVQVSECLESSISYGGQVLNIAMALPREELAKVSSDQFKKEDRRNLYLAKEGAIFPDSDAAKDLSKADLQKRTKACAEKKAKLANPNYIVSRTRLCVRNLPTSVDEKKLKEIFQNAATSSKARVTQVKLLRSNERVDSKGVGRSKGYGFVEFSDHESALSALRATNNNPTLFGRTKCLIVDFAVENSRVLRLWESKQAKQSLLRGGSTCPAVNKRAGKRLKWQLKWQARRKKKKENSKNAVAKETKVTPAPHTRHVKSERVKSSPKIAQEKRHIKGDITGKETDLFQGLTVNTVRVPRKSRTGTSTEEADFARMVDKYRKKLSADL